MVIFMGIPLEINHSLINLVAKFYEHHGGIYSLIQLSDDLTNQKLNRATNHYSALASVVKDKHLLSIAEKNPEPNYITSLVPQSKLKDYLSYIKTLERFPEIFKPGKFPNFEQIVDINNRLLGLPKGKSNLRTKEKRIDIDFEENGVIRHKTTIVNTPADKMEQRFNAFLKWLNDNYQHINPLLLAAITHIKIAEIHPFQAGNGRMSKLLARGVLFSHKIDTKLLFIIDDYYLEEQYYYFDLIEDTIRTGRYERWLDFYLNGMLLTAMETNQLLSNYTAGTIDLENTRIIQLKERERNVLQIVKQEENISGAEIARRLSTTRQNAHIILTSLINKGLITKTGQNTGARFSYLKHKE